MNNITMKKVEHLYDVDIPLMSVRNHESTFVSVDLYKCASIYKQGTWHVAYATATCGPEGNEHVIEGPVVPFKECKDFDDAIIKSMQMLVAMFEVGKKNAATNELIEKLQGDIDEMKGLLEE